MNAMLMNQLYILYEVSLNSKEPTSILFSMMVVPIYILTNSLEGFPFLHTFSSIYL